jgi:hypothetical protein
MRDTGLLNNSIRGVQPGINKFLTPDSCNMQDYILCLI